MTAPPQQREEPFGQAAYDLSGDHLFPDDAALIEASWREPETFAGLYDRHAAPIHRYVSRRLGDGMADDIVADTFLAAFRDRGHAYHHHRRPARDRRLGQRRRVGALP